MSEDLLNTGDFLFYNNEEGTISVQIIVGEDTVWTTQRGMAEIFDTSKQNVSLHLINIFKEGELDENSVVKEILTTAEDGKKYPTKFYQLDAIIAVGYRVNSYNATQFRIWATKILREYLIKGFALDDERLKQGNNLFNKDHFRELLERIREIRTSEKMFYEQVKDIFSTSVDYDKNSPSAHDFFATIQNKLEYAITGKTSAELIRSRANATLPNMNLQTWKNVKKGGDIVKSDVTVGKNYLNENELTSLKLLVTMFLDYAESQAQRNIIMKMSDWIKKIDSFILFNDYKVLEDSGSVRKEIADRYAEKEYEKYKAIQQQSRISDFKQVIKDVNNGKVPKKVSLPYIVDSQENISPIEQPTEFNNQLKGLINTPTPPKKEKKAK